MTLRYKILAVVCLLGAFFFLGRCNRSSATVPKPSTVFPLPKDDKERLMYDEKTHTITIQTQDKTGGTNTIKEYAKNPSVEFKKNGTVVVSRHLTGFENEFFLGAGYADTGRIFVGDNLFHIRRFDIGMAVGFTTSHQYVVLKPYIGVGYNIWSNTSLNLGIDPLHHGIAGFVSVKL